MSLKYDFIKYRGTWNLKDLFYVQILVASHFFQRKIERTNNNTTLWSILKYFWGFWKNNFQAFLKQSDHLEELVLAANALTAVPKLGRMQRLIHLNLDDNRVGFLQKKRRKIQVYRFLKYFFALRTQMKWACGKLQFRRKFSLFENSKYDFLLDDKKCKIARKNGFLKHKATSLISIFCADFHGGRGRLQRLGAALPSPVAGQQNLLA